jgi:uncharacterized protein YdhG (YjbR/CyaY superfamily)
VKTVAPDAVESISYGILAFRTKKVFCYCGAFKDHITIFPPVNGDAGLIRDLAAQRNAKGKARFSHDAPFPPKLIARAIRTLASQNARDNRNKRRKRRATA